MEAMAKAAPVFLACVNLSKNFLATLMFRSESECKGNGFIHTMQIFS